MVTNRLIRPSFLQYELRGREATYLGPADLHESKYDKFEVSVEMTTHNNPEAYTATGHCLFTLVGIHRQETEQPTRSETELT